jgi:hypothetical protein
VLAAGFEKAVAKIPPTLGYSGSVIGESVDDRIGHGSSPRAQQHFRSGSENNQVRGREETSTEGQEQRSNN